MYWMVKKVLSYNWVDERQSPCCQCRCLTYGEVMYNSGTGIYPLRGVLCTSVQYILVNFSKTVPEWRGFSSTVLLVQFWVRMLRVLRCRSEITSNVQIRSLRVTRCEELYSFVVPLYWSVLQPISYFVFCLEHEIINSSFISYDNARKEFIRHATSKQLHTSLLFMNVNEAKAGTNF